MVKNKTPIIIKSTIRVYQDELEDLSKEELKEVINRKIEFLKSDVFNRVTRYRNGTLPLCEAAREYRESKGA